MINRSVFFPAAFCNFTPMILNPCPLYFCLTYFTPFTSRLPSLSSRSLSPSLPLPLSLWLLMLHSCMSEQQTARQQQSASAASCASPNNPSNKAQARSAETSLLPLSSYPFFPLTDLSLSLSLLILSRHILPSSVLGVDAQRGLRQPPQSAG